MTNGYNKKAAIAMDTSHYLYGSWPTLFFNFAVVLLIAVVVWFLVSVLQYFIEASNVYFLGPFPKGSSPTNAFLTLCAVMLLGALLRGLMMYRPAWRECEGDGSSQAIAYFHETYDEAEDAKQAAAKRYKRNTLSYALRKVIITFLTIGTGGSGGLEGPAIPIGESVGAAWSKFFKISSADDLRVFQMAGIASGMAAILNAPVTAAVFAAEIVFSDHLIYRPLIFALIASLFSFELNNHLLHATPIFSVKAHTGLYSIFEYLEVVFVAIFVSAPSGFAVNVLFKQLQKYFAYLPLMLRAPIGAVGTLLIAGALWFGLGMEPHYILGISEEVVVSVLHGNADPLLQIWWVLFVLVIAKTFATGFTLMSGGSAGKLVPAMFMGGMSGAGVYFALLKLALVTAATGPEIFMIAGIASALVAVIEVPLTAIILVIEMFGSSFGPPAIIAVVVCHKIVKRFQLYYKQ